MARTRARKSLRVRLTAADIEFVADRLRDVLPIAVTITRETRTIAEVLEPLGATRRERIRRGAIAMSGTSSGKPYLAARRRLERYTTTGKEKRRGDRPRVLEEITKIIRRPNLPTNAGIVAFMRADVVYVGQTKLMPAGGPPGHYVRPRALGTMRARMRAGDEEGAARAFLNAWAFSYGLVTEEDAALAIGNITDFGAEVANE